MSKQNKKEKKEKITYIDDGRTIVDMSGVGGGKTNNSSNKRRSTAGEKWQTYWEAVKMMFLPMLVVIGIICVAFLLLYLAMS